MHPSRGYKWAKPKMVHVPFSFYARSTSTNITGSSSLGLHGLHCSGRTHGIGLNNTYVHHYMASKRCSCNVLLITQNTGLRPSSLHLTLCHRSFFVLVSFSLLFFFGFCPSGNVTFDSRCRVPPGPRMYKSRSSRSATSELIILWPGQILPLPDL